MIYKHHELGSASLYWLRCMMIGLAVFDSIHASITYIEDSHSARMQEVSDVVFLQDRSRYLHYDCAIIHYKPVVHDNIYDLYTS